MLRGQSPIAGAGEIREYSVDIVYTIADCRGSGEGRKGDLTDVTRTIADCWVGGGWRGWMGEGICECCVDNRRMFEGIRGLGVPTIRSGSGGGDHGGGD